MGEGADHAHQNDEAQPGSLGALGRKDLAVLCLSALEAAVQGPGQPGGWLSKAHGGSIWGVQVLVSRPVVSSCPHLLPGGKVSAQRKKFGDGCQGNVLLPAPSINHRLVGR